MSERQRSRRKWIKVVSSDVPPESLPYKHRYCGLCKGEMDFDIALDAWICKKTTCGAVLYRGYHIGPTKGEQHTLVTITDPYGDLQRPFAANLKKTKEDSYHGLQRPLLDKHRLARHPNEIIDR